jgi:hypothetical protein
MAKAHGSSAKDDKPFEGLRKKGMSEERRRRSPTAGVPRPEAEKAPERQERGRGDRAPPKS